jgi:hypothetical protein
MDPLLVVALTGLAVAIMLSVLVYRAEKNTQVRSHR